jgi:hypothetical protein
VPNSTFWVNGNELYFDDPNLTTYQWYVNGMLLSDETSSTIIMSEGGEYTCWITNIYGCSAFSNSYLYCPDILPVYDPLAQEVSVDPSFESYQWFFNGELIDGATGYFVNATEQGNYSVLISTTYGCTTLSDVVTVTSNITSPALSELALFPNPASDVTILSGLIPGSTITIRDAQGRIVQTWTTQQSTLEIATDQLSAGVYPLTIYSGNIQKQIKLIKL